MGCRSTTAPADAGDAGAAAIHVPQDGAAPGDSSMLAATSPASQTRARGGTVGLAPRRALQAYLAHEPERAERDAPTQQAEQQVAALAKPRRWRLEHAFQPLMG